MSRIVVVLCLFVTALALAQVSEEQGRVGPRPGRLSGHVDIGPVSPVERPGQKVKVPPEWYRHYKIAIYQHGPQNGQMRSHLLRVVTQLKLSDTGDFSVELKPGPYEVGVVSDNPSKSLPPRQTVTVTSGKSTHVTIKIDSGIR